MRLLTLILLSASFSVQAQVMSGMAEIAREEAAARAIDFTDCKRSDDGRSIACPDGLFVKSSGVNDSARGGPVKETLKGRKSLSGSGGGFRVAPQ